MEQDPQKEASGNDNNKVGNTGETKPPKIRLSPTASSGGAIPKPKIKLQSSGNSDSAIPPLSADKPAPVKAVEDKGEPAVAKPAVTRRPDTVSVPPLNPPKVPSHTGPIVDAAPAPKTIKIKRPGTATLKPPTVENQKKQTSRVDINAALAENAAPDTPPRTIKLKRPGTTVLEKATPEPSSSPDRTTQFKIDNARKSETSRIELPPEATVEMPKRRKTVQIKRSGSGGGGGSSTSARRPGTRLVMNTSSSPAVSAASDDDIPDIVITNDESTVVFSLVSLVATIVTLIVLYVLAAQTILPSLPWAGKL